jgi:hypothetical protein
MQETHDIDSILNAINEIETKPKKKISNTTSSQNFTPKINHELIISPDVDKIIKEAEEYKRKPQTKIHQADLNKKESHKIEVQKNNNSLEDIQTQIIENLYSKFKKKVKKNTLKIIFELHLKIKNLENKIEHFQNKKDQSFSKNKPTPNFNNKEELSSSANNRNAPNNRFNNINPLKEQVVETLKIQDSSIDILNEKIKSYKKIEEKLLFQIIDLEQDKTLLLNKVKRLNISDDYKNIINNMKITLKSVYKQIVKQKKIYLDLKTYSIKIKQDSNIYKENYEKLVIKNNDLETKLTASKK